MRSSSGPSKTVSKKRKTRKASTSSRPRNAETGRASGVVIPRGKGKLRVLAEMPLDIVYEIFGHVGEIDILHLSRSSKVLRNMLMSKKSISVWKQVLSRNDTAGFPRREFEKYGLSEPQLINLGFSTHCHRCLKDNVDDKHILWLFKIRLCRDCLVPSGYQLAAKTRSIRLSRLPPMQAHMIHLMIPSPVVTPTSLPTSGSGLNPATCVRYDGPALVLPNSQYGIVQQNGVWVANPTPTPLILVNPDELVYDTGDLKLVTREIAAFTDQSQVLEYVETRRKMLEEERKISDTFRKWRTRFDKREEEEKERFLKTRKEEICKRLSDLGYSEEIAFINRREPTVISEHRQVKTLKPLTEKAWSAMLPNLREILESRRVELQAQKRKSMFKARLGIVLNTLKEYALTLEPREAAILPRTVDVCMMPKVHSIVFNHDISISNPEESFTEIKAGFIQLCKDWQESKKMILISLLPPLIEDDMGMDRLLLAKTFFECDGCDEPISYPRVLAHSCLTESGIGSRNWDDDEGLMFRMLDSSPWNVDGDQVRYSVKAEQVAERILRVCGVDHRTATSEDVDNLAPWLECPSCWDKKDGRAVFPWRKAVIHELKHLRLDQGLVDWRILSLEDTSKAKSIVLDKEQSHPFDSDREYDDFVCMHCRARVSRRDLNQHLRSRHPGLVNQDYQLDLDASMDQPPFAIRIPGPKPGPEVIEILDDSDGESESKEPDHEYVEISD